MMLKADSSAWYPYGDFRRLNDSIVCDRYPIPHIHDFAMELQGRHISTKLDLIKVYYQIPFEESDIPKTAITTLFWFTQILQSTKNTLWFKKLSSFFFKFDRRGIKMFTLHIRLNNTSKNMDEHLEYLLLVFYCLQHFRFKMNFNKCTFGVKKLSTLGYEIESGISPLPVKRATI